MDPSKQQNPPPASTWKDEGLEFEITDFGEARRVLDNESIAQFDVATAVSPAQWKRLRRAILPTSAVCAAKRRQKPRRAALRRSRRGRHAA